MDVNAPKAIQGLVGN